MFGSARNLLPVFLCSHKLKVPLSRSSHLFLSSRKSGRGISSVFTWKDLNRLKEANKKAFTREWGKRSGSDTGIEDIKIILSLQNPDKWRQLDSKKRLQLGIIFHNSITEVIEQDEVLAKHRISIFKVEVAPTFSEICVLWLAKGDGSDKKIAEDLASAENSIRLQVSEAFGNVTLPAVKFIMNDKHLLQKKMNKLLREADYGMHYRSLSRTAAILGSLNDHDSLPNKNKTSDGVIKESL